METAWPRPARRMRIVTVCLVACMAPAIAVGAVGCRNQSDKEATAAQIGSGPHPPAPPADTALPPGMVSAGTGVFTATQAKRGERAWATSCGRCHALSHHSGSIFEAGWNRQRVWSLYDRIATTMPQDDPGIIPEQELIDIVAFVLEVNGMPPGKTALTADPETLRKIRIEVPKPADR